MTRAEMEYAIIRNYVYCNFKGMDLADIQADYEEIKDDL